MNARPAFENKPAMALRMMFAETLPERRGNGQFARRRDLQRACIHEELRRAAPPVAGQRTTQEPSNFAILTPPVRALRTTHFAGRAACAVVLIVGAVVVLTVTYDVSAAIAASPLGILARAVLGRAA